MNYKIEFSFDYGRDVLVVLGNPRALGKALTRQWSVFWRCRARHFRIICKIKDTELLILVLEIAYWCEVED